MINQTNIHRPRQRGAALLTALALLAVCTLLGASWLRYMLSENEQTDLYFRQTRAEHYAVAGIQASIGDLEAFLADNSADKQLTSQFELEFPFYTGVGKESAALQADSERQGHAQVTLIDENAKINLNHATPKVLRRLLNIDGQMARAIRASLPRPDNPSPNARWFTSVDELVTRNLITPEQLSSIDESAITVYTVRDHTAAAGFINVNSAPPLVLEALLDVDAATAARIAEARPFNTIQELAAAAGKEPATFNTRPAAPGTGGISPELSFHSRCFRIISEGWVSRKIPGVERQVLARAHTEAVVLFDDAGKSHVQYWHETKGGASPPQ